MTEPLFADLKKQLLRYNHADDLEKQAMLLDAVAATLDLSGDPQNNDEAKKHFQVLCYAKSLIKHAENLCRIENRFFGISQDFTDMELSEELEDLFEIREFSNQIILDERLENDNPKIWERFQQELQTHINKHGMDNRFRLTELNNPPKDPLYPIQMFGTRPNEAVDQIHIDAEGKISFVSSGEYDEYSLLGSGMMDIDQKASSDNLIKKMLEKYLEERHPNLHTETGDIYDKLPPKRFRQELEDNINKHKEPLPEEFKEELINKLNNDKMTNTEHLNKIVDLIDRELHNCYSRYDYKLENSLRVLRVQVQIHAFKLTPLFTNAIKLFETHAKRVDIETFLDPRVLGGSQLSHTFIIPESLEEWFKKQLGADEYNYNNRNYNNWNYNNRTEKLTLLESISSEHPINSSHLLIALAAYNHVLDNNTLTLNYAWNKKHFEDAKRKIIVECYNQLLEPKELIEQMTQKLRASIESLPDEKQDKINVHIDTLFSRLQDIPDYKEQEECFNKYATQCKLILEGKYDAVLKTILIISAVTVAAALVGAAGFGIGFVMGLWTGPGALFTAIAGASVAALGVVAVSGASDKIADTLTGLGFFKPGKELTEINKYSHYRKTLNALLHYLEIKDTLGNYEEEEEEEKKTYRDYKENDDDLTYGNKNRY